MKTIKKMTCFFISSMIMAGHAMAINPMERALGFNPYPEQSRGLDSYRQSDRRVEIYPGIWRGVAERGARQNRNQSSSDREDASGASSLEGDRMGQYRIINRSTPPPQQSPSASRQYGGGSQQYGGFGSNMGGATNYRNDSLSQGYDSERIQRNGGAQLQNPSPSDFISPRQGQQSPRSLESLLTNPN